MTTSSRPHIRNVRRAGSRSWQELNSPASTWASDTRQPRSRLPFISIRLPRTRCRKSWISDGSELANSMRVSGITVAMAAFLLCAHIEVVGVHLDAPHRQHQVFGPGHPCHLATRLPGTVPDQGKPDKAPRPAHAEAGESRASPPRCGSVLSGIPPLA